MKGSYDNLTIFANIAVVHKQKYAYTPRHTHAASIDNWR